MQITRSSIDTAKGPGDWFTGDVYIDSVAAAPPPSRVTANLVHFMPGARTHWHRHPLEPDRVRHRGRRPVPAPRRDRSRSSAPETASSSRPTRNTGTAPQPTGSWSTWPSTKATSSTTSSTGSSP